MPISKGAHVPDVQLSRIGENGPESVKLTEKLKGRRVIVFGLPGAFTPTCHSAHLPSFMRNSEALKAKGVDEIICVAVNDPYVMHTWGEVTGASLAGITMLGDPQSIFTKALGMEFTAEPAGLISRSKRYSMLVEDGVVKEFNEEPGPGQCSFTGGETLLSQLG